MALREGVDPEDEEGFLEEGFEDSTPHTPQPTPTGEDTDLINQGNFSHFLRLQGIKNKKLKNKKNKDKNT